jgi:hypothetical protein
MARLEHSRPGVCRVLLVGKRGTRCCDSAGTRLIDLSLPIVQDKHDDHDLHGAIIARIQ